MLCAPILHRWFEILSAVTFFFINFDDVIYGFKYCTVWGLMIRFFSLLQVPFSNDKQFLQGFYINLRNFDIGDLMAVFWELQQIHPCGSLILIELWGSFIEIILRHGCSPVGLPRIFRSACSWEHLWGTASEHVNM